MAPPIPREGPMLGRRTLLLGAAAGLAALGLASCASPGAANGAIPLKFWHLLSGGDGRTMAELVARANAANPTFDVTQTVLTWGPPYYTKLAMASAGGRAPDLAVMHAARLPGYAPGGLLDPWDLDLLAEFGVRREDFGDRVWESGLYDGDVYSIALDSHPFILFYNTDHAAAAGLMEGERMRQPRDADDFLDMVTAMKEASGGSGLSYGYVNDGAQMWRLWYTLYLQQGGVMELPIGGKARIDDGPAVEAFRFMQQLVDESRGVPNADIQTALAEFISGDSGMLLSGVWELPSLQAAGIPIDAMPIPNLYGTPAAYADSHAFVLPHQNDVDEDARREVYRFVAAILKDSFDWAGAGHVPAYLPVTEDPAYAELSPQANYAEVADIINYDPPAWFTGSGSDFQSLFAENLQPVLLAGADPQAGIDRFRAAVDELLSKPNPV